MSSKHYAMKKCSTFARKQNMTILQFLQEMNIKICEGADGSRVDLDKLSATQITNLKRKIDEVDVPIDPKYKI